MAGGRKTKLTTELLNKLMGGIRLGMTYKDAAGLAGISESTFYNWKEKAEKAKSGKFKAFLESLKKANYEAQAIALKKISEGIRGGTEYTEIKRIKNEKGVVVEEHETVKKSIQGWHCAAWLLERRFPELWGRKDRVPEKEAKVDPFEKWVNDLQDASAKFDV